MGTLNNGVAAIWRAGHAMSGLLRWSADTTRPGAVDDYWYEPFGPDTTSGIKVTPDIALKASAIFSVVRILAETMATMPLAMHRDLGPRGRQLAPEHPLNDLIEYQPNKTQTAVEFWEFMIAHAVLRGNCYAEIVPGPRGAVDQLLPLHPDRVSVLRVKDGSLRFKVTNANGTHRVLLQEEIFRVPGLSFNGITGVSVVELAADDIGLGMAADNYASRVFSNRLNIGGFLIHPSTLTPDGQKNLLDGLMKMASGPANSHRPIVLQEGMKFERGTDNASDSQLLEARQWQIRIIAQRWRVPLHMMGIDDQTNRSTVEAQALDFVKYTLRPWAKRIEQAIRRDLIVAQGTYKAKYNMEALLRGDSKARSDYFAKALGSGGHPQWMTQNEVRAIEGMNPIFGGDTLIMPANDTTPAPKADDTGAERIARLVSKEAAAMRKSHIRLDGDPDKFREWVSAFFGGHVSSVMELLRVPRQTAKSYCNHVKTEVLSANDLSALLDRWESGRADEVNAALAADAD